jgi:hypothetical protein
MNDTATHTATHTAKAAAQAVNEAEIVWKEANVRAHKARYNAQLTGGAQ